MSHCFYWQLERNPFPLFWTAEDDVERAVGRIQKFLRERGTHWREDLEREYLSSVVEEDAKVEFQLRGRTRDFETAEDDEAEESPRRMMFAPSFFEDPGLRAQFAALRSLSATKPYGNLVRDAQGHVFVTPEQTDLTLPLSTLAASHLVFCLCLESAPCAIHQREL
jgi:hypothetical protein